MAGSVTRLEAVRATALAFLDEAYDGVSTPPGKGLEHARAVADVLRRRVPLFRDARDQGLGAAERVAAILSDELGWPPTRRERALADYRSAVEQSRRWRDDLT